jgi:hypothetical protein
MCHEEKVNASVRFLLYAGILLYAATFRPKYVLVSWVAVLALAVLHYWGGSPAHDAGSVAPLYAGRQTRTRTSQNPFANVLHADPQADLPGPAWNQEEADKANALFRSKMFMDINDAAGLQSCERQFMQMPEKDMDAFVAFLMQKP